MTAESPVVYNHSRLVYDHGANDERKNVSRYPLSPV